MECIQKERDRNLEIYSDYKKGFYLLKELESRIEGNLNPLRDLEYLKGTIDELEKYRFYNLKEIPVKLVKNKYLRFVTMRMWRYIRCQKDTCQYMLMITRF